VEMGNHTLGGLFHPKGAFFGGMLRFDLLSLLGRKRAIREFLHTKWVLSH
jgi:hypothetical protein